MENADVSNISIFGIIATLTLCLLLFVLPRRYAVTPIILCAMYMTLGQMIVIFGLHFSVMRILIAAGIIRVLIKNEYVSISKTKLDKFIIGWLIISLIINTILWQTTDALVNRLGFTYNAAGLYFIFRSIVRDMPDILRLVKTISIAIIPLAIIMMNEYATGKNMFAVLGGVPEFTTIRDGKLRCQGPFRHPILAGTFGATHAVLTLSLWLEKSNSRLMIIMGFIAALVIVVIATSSGALLAIGSAIFCIFLWPIRKNMRIVRWSLLGGAILLHFIMTAPVWYIFARLSDIFGGGGWHRSHLIDQAITHFRDWWLLGTTYTADWMPYALASNPSSADITNQYLIEGINGGIITMILFISIIVAAFSIIGVARNRMSNINHNYEKIIWILGASLMSHVVSYFSVPYFDQMIVFWYLLLASIAALGMMDDKNTINSFVSV